MVSYPYSVAGTVNDIDVSQAKAGTSSASSDGIWVWNGAGYDRYFLSSFDPATYDPKVCWVSVDSGEEVDFDLPLGKGVWYNAYEATTISFAKPY